MCTLCHFFPIEFHFSFKHMKHNFFFNVNFYIYNFNFFYSNAENCEIM